MRRPPALLTLLLLASCRTTTTLPDSAEHPDFGLELQAYPAGIVPGAQARWRMDEDDAVFVRAAANLTDRQDFGEHDDESGGGFGLGAGWRHAVAGDLGADGWLYGARLDLWSLSIDWKDPGPREGTTDVLVLQPTAEFGYGWSTAAGSRIELTATLGAEINVDTDGEDVGEGAILLLGLTWLP